MSRFCMWHDADIPEDQAVQVGRGITAYACRACADENGLLSVSEHPPGSNGTPLAVDRQYIGRRDLPPIAPGQRA